MHARSCVQNNILYQLCHHCWLRLSIAHLLTGKSFSQVSLWLDCELTQSDDFASSLFRLMNRRVAGTTGEPNSAREAARIGANDARHREHLMAPARQLTS
jgi:hypothetical protein